MAVKTALELTQMRNMCPLAKTLGLGLMLQYLDSDGTFRGPIAMDTVVIDRLTSVTTGAFGAAAGATGVALAGVDPDQVLQAHGYISAAAAAGAYAGAYNTLTITATQTNDVSAFATWSELYLTGDISLKSNHAAVWGNLEMADAGGTLTLPGGTGYTAALVGTVIAPDGLTLTAGGILAGCHVDSLVNSSATINGILAAFSANTGSGNKNWEYGLYVNGADYLFGLASASAYEDGAKIGSMSGIPDTTAAGVIRFKIGATAYYIPFHAAGDFTGE